MKRVTRGCYQDAYLTVFLSLILSVMISLCLLLVLGARENTRRMEIECVTDIGMNNVLAEYHRELLRQYDLFFIDTSYGSSYAHYVQTEGHLLEYLEKNMGSDDIFLPFLYRDPLKLKVDSVKLTQVSVASDDGGAVLRRQAVEVMYQRIGVAYLQQLQSWFSEIKAYKLDSTDVLTRQKQACRALEEWKGNAMTENGMEQTEPVENPVVGASAFWEAGILNYVTEEKEKLSTQAVPVNACLSNRELLVGTGMNPAVEFEDNWWQQLIFHEYIMAYTGHYGAEKEEGYLQYQTEYIIAGKDNDLENLKSVVNAIFGIRSAANLCYLLSDEEKMEAVELLAYGLAILIMLPEAKDVIKSILVLTWALAESLYDVSVLLKGERVPLLKSAESWHYSLEEILSFGGVTDGKKGESGLAYEDYLRLFLMLQDVQTTTCRLMDVMEMDIRQTPGNQYFRMDGCIDSLTAVIHYSGRDGKMYSINRSYGY
ncbi:MAG: hypothetical protein J1E65_07160 [Lachnospiraceae bacterium]|nr:hypothetical protein [Lachnospiraceae bacterium]